MQPELIILKYTNLDDPHIKQSINEHCLKSFIDCHLFSSKLQFKNSYFLNSFNT